MNNFLLFVLLLAATACQSESGTSQSRVSQAVPTDMATMKLAASPQAAEETEPLPSPQPEQNQPTAVINRQLVRNAQLRIRVNDFTASGKNIEQAVQQAGGQLERSNETKTDNSIENALTIRIAATRFDALLASILKESMFTDTKTITTEDITRRYVDMDARIRSKKAVEETYLKLLKQARSVADVLKVEEQLGQIREEREVQEAEFRQLKDEIALSTIQLTYYQQTEVALRPEEPFYAQIWRNFTDGFRLMGNVVIGAFYFLPVGLVVLLVSWLIQRWRRQKQQANV
ncbi:DUF4349 domain-containing protein [Spirosoma jeollabukense]